eukprot:9487194-Pyramimonas_sp.AAC.3
MEPSSNSTVGSARADSRVCEPMPIPRSLAKTTSYWWLDQALETLLAKLAQWARESSGAACLMRAVVWCSNRSRCASRRALAPWGKPHIPTGAGHRDPLEGIFRRSKGGSAMMAPMSEYP